ncbi:hypothetical protein D910_02376 [Dendroctonus ponderosae]
MDYLMTDSPSFYNQTMSDIMNSDKTLAGGIIQQENPWKTAVDSLYVEYFEVLQGQTESRDALEMLSELARCCSDALKIVRSLKSKVAIKTVDEELWLEKERDTWRLLYILFQDRLAVQSMMDEDAQIQYFGKSEKTCVENLFKRENLIRECQLVIDWLEAEACEKDDSVLHFSDSTVGWENTLHQLQSAETIAFGSSRPIVDKLDPDAPHYQKKPLHDIDMDDEKRLNYRIFQEIRCGKLGEAQKLARQCGHSWRAAIFEGWHLFHDPNIKEDIARSPDMDNSYQEMDSNELKDIEGNSNRDLWKVMALRYSIQEWISPYERAAVGVFCGNVNAILPVCNRWEDNLWAYMKSLVDIRVESEIRDCCTKDSGYLPLPEEYWLQRMSLHEVFTKLESSKNKAVRDEAKEHEHLIQKYIILDEIQALLKELADWSQSADISTHFLRFTAHVVLFLDQIGQGHKRDCVETVVKSYIKRLMDMNETQLVAYYVSKLNTSNQVHLYAQHLENIIELQERQLALEYAEQCGLDVLAIAKQIVVNTRSKPEHVDEAGNLQKKITETDELVISAIDWLVFFENQRLDVLIQTNAIIFKFLLLGKLDAAQLAFNKIPSDAIRQVTAEVEDTSEETNQIIKEHLSYKVYLEAYEAFNEWFKQMKNQPEAPEDLPENTQFSQKVAYEHRLSQHKVEVERWKLTNKHLAITANKQLYNVLLFPDGWLNGAKDCYHLRKTVLPEVTFLLCSVLSESEMYEECVQLADIIASEKHCLYKEFTEEQLSDLLTKIAEAAVALTEASKDPWGNEITA